MSGSQIAAFSSPPFLRNFYIFLLAHSHALSPYFRQ